MEQGSLKRKGFNFLLSKREICLACDQRNQCKRPIKDTEGEDTSFYDCEKYKVEQ